MELRYIVIYLEHSAVFDIKACYIKKTNNNNNPKIRFQAKNVINVL